MKYFHAILSLVILSSSIMYSQILRVVDIGGTVPGSYPTITDAVNAANPGDTISVLPGVYYDNPSITKKLYMYAKDSTVEVYSNTFWFHAGSAGSLIYGFTFRGNVQSDFWRTEPIIFSKNRFIESKIYFSGMTIIANNYFKKGDGGYGIMTDGSDSSHNRMLIFNNTLDSCSITVGGNYIDVIGNRITNIPNGILISESTNDIQLIANEITNCNSAIYPGRERFMSNFVISNNLISNCYWGLQTYVGGTLGGVISNNVFYNCTNGSIQCFGGTCPGTNLIYSNIFSTNGNGLAFPNTEWANNCFYNSGSIPSPGSGNINSDPLFMDPASGDFRLQAGSPCIDAGYPAIQYSDIDRTRNDMGIYGGPNSMNNYENLSNPMAMDLINLPTVVRKGTNLIITGSGISK